MKKLIVGFIAGILLSTACFVPLLVWRVGKGNEIGVELVSGCVGSGSTDVLRWRFSAEMVPVEKPVEFSPDVEGTFRWTKPNELVFQPNEGWRGCTPFTATLSEGLRGVDLRALADPLIFTFHSDPLAVRSISQSNYSSDNQVRLDIGFSEKVSPEQLKNHLKIQTPSGQNISCAIYNRQSRETIEVVFQHTETNEVVVRIDAGLQSIVGPAGLGSNVVQNVKLSRDLRLLRVVTRNQPFGAGHIEARFNLPIDMATARDLIKVEPEVEINVESRTRYSRHICRILGDFKPGTRYVVAFDPALGSTAGAALGKAVSRTVYFPDARAAVEFTARGSYMSPKGGMKIPLRLVNSGDCKAIITRIYPNNLVQLAARRSHRYSFYGTPHQNIGHVVGELELPIDSPRNEIAEHTLDLRPVLEGQTGAFHIEVRSDKGARSSHYVVVSDFGLSVKQSQNDFLVWANSLRTLAPLPDADVKVYSLENQVLLAGKTDADGIARFDLTDRITEGKPFLVSIEKDTDLSFLRLDSSAVSLRGGVGERPYLDAGYEAYLFTDRGIYRPGETTHLKVVVRDPNAECAEAFPLTLKIYRPDGKVDRTLGAMLGEYGTAEFEIPWPDYAATGKYRLEATVPGGEKPVGQTVVSLEEFVP
ncbi:MAG: hypothetical protein KAU94_08555, partial [Verrucomicrobia bacterium]|nr:hypothetical protein [Verrucomicrobiota bacterium]